MTPLHTAYEKTADTCCTGFSDSKGNHWKDVNNVEPPYTEFTRYEDGKWLGWEVIYEYWP